MESPQNPERFTQSNEEETIWFGYDLLGRITQRRVDDDQGALYATWTYDRTGHKGLLDYAESFSEGTTSTGWQVRVTNTGYDARNRVTSTRWEVKELPSATWDHTFVMGFGFDSADRARTVTYPADDTGGSGETVTYEYKSSTGLPDSLKDTGNTVYVSTSSYTPQGAPLSQTRGATGYANRVVREWSYFTDSLRVAQVKAKTIHEGNPTYDIARIDYWYTPGGNITERVDWRNSEQVECYDYDPLDRLTTAFTSDRDGLTGEDCGDGYVNTGAGAYDQAYTYNPIGNLKRAGNWTYGGSGAGPHALTSIGSTATFGYDGAGRETGRTVSGVTTTTGWSPSGMTQTRTTSSDTTTYIYTPDDVLFARVDPDGSLNVRIGGYWETDGTTTRTMYRFAGSLTAVRTQTATTNTLTHLVDDHQGTTSVIHQLGGATGRVWYDPWGMLRATSGASSPTPYGYTGQHHEPTGLIDYNARQYDPTHGRFTSPDSLIPDPTNPQDHNRYTYTRNNPATFTDPSGHITDVGDGGHWPEKWLCDTALGCPPITQEPEPPDEPDDSIWDKMDQVADRAGVLVAGAEGAAILCSVATAPTPASVVCAKAAFVGEHVGRAFDLYALGYCLVGSGLSGCDVELTAAVLPLVTAGVLRELTNDEHLVQLAEWVTDTGESGNRSGLPDPFRWPPAWPQGG